MLDVKNMSVKDLAMKLNAIIKVKSSGKVISNLERIVLDYEWNICVMELWERIPSLQDDPDIRPVLTVINPDKEDGIHNPKKRELVKGDFEN